MCAAAIFFVVRGTIVSCSGLIFRKKKYNDNPNTSSDSKLLARNSLRTPNVLVCRESKIEIMCNANTVGDVTDAASRHNNTRNTPSPIKQSFANAQLTYLYMLELLRKVTIY